MPAALRFSERGVAAEPGLLAVGEAQFAEPPSGTSAAAPSDRAVLWAHPAFANGHVIARNDAEVVRMSLTAADYE